MSLFPHPDRYQQMEYRRSGRSGIKLPAISLGLWHNFGDSTRVDNSRELLRHAVDLGITHFDLGLMGIGVRVNIWSPVWIRA